MTSTLLEVVAETARRCAAAFSSTCTSAGTTTTLVDLAATDVGVDVNFAAGGWIFRPDAPTAADQLRGINVAGFAPTTGTWTVSRAWADAPDSAETYYLFAILPPKVQPGVPDSWQRLVNRALANTWFDDRVIIGSGDGTQVRFTISGEDGWTPNWKFVKGVYVRSYDTEGEFTDLDMNKRGRHARIEHGYGLASVLLSLRPSTTEDVVLAVSRTYPALDAYTDTTECPLELAVLRTKYELYKYLNDVPQTRGQYEGEASKARLDWSSYYRMHGATGAVVTS